MSGNGHKLPICISKNLGRILPHRVGSGNNGLKAALPFNLQLRNWL